MRQCFEIKDKKIGKIESIWFELDKHQVIILNEKHKIIFNSDKYIKSEKPKEVDNDKEKGRNKRQTEEAKEDGSKPDESVQEV
jgi:hypothetical protein